jgi:hypothetical protein
MANAAEKKPDEQLLVDLGNENVKRHLARRAAALEKLAAAQKRLETAQAVSQGAIEAHIANATDANKRRALDARDEVELLLGHVTKANSDVADVERDLVTAQGDLAAREQELAALDKAKEIARRWESRRSLRDDVASLFEQLTATYDAQRRFAKQIVARVREDVATTSRLHELGEIVDNPNETAPLAFIRPIVERQLKNRPGLAPAVLQAVEGGLFGAMAHDFAPTQTAPLGAAFEAAFHNKLLDGDWVPSKVEQFGPAQDKARAYLDAYFKAGTHVRGLAALSAKRLELENGTEEGATAIAPAAARTGLRESILRIFRGDGEEIELRR